MNNEQVSAIRKVAGWLISLAWAWAIFKTIQDWSAMNDRYGEFRGEVFWEFILTNLYDAIVVMTLIFIFNGVATLLEYMDGKRECFEKQSKNNTQEHTERHEYMKRAVNATDAEKFAQELKSFETKVLGMMVHQHNIYSKEEIEMIRNELLRREAQTTQAIKNTIFGDGLADQSPKDN